MIFVILVSIAFYYFFNRIEEQSQKIVSLEAKLDCHSHQIVELETLIQNRVDDCERSVDERLWDAAADSRETAMVLIERAVAPIRASHSQLVQDTRDMVEFERKRGLKHSLILDVNHRKIPAYVAYDHSVWMSKTCIAEMRLWFIKTLPEFTQPHVNWFVHTYLLGVYNCDGQPRACCGPIVLASSKHYSSYDISQDTGIETVQPASIRLTDWSCGYRLVWPTGSSIKPYELCHITQTNGWAMFVLAKGNALKLEKSLTSQSAELLFDDAFGVSHVIAPWVNFRQNSAEVISVYNASCLMPHIIQHLYSLR